MRKYSLLFSLLALILLFSGCSAEAPVTENTGARVFGDFAASDLNGNAVDQEIFKKRKLTMVNIWATFCGPCINEMPELGQLAEEYGEDLQIIGIVVDAADQNGNVLPQQKADALEIVKNTGASYTHLLPSKDLNDAYLSGVQSVPTTLFVDENGCLVGASLVGARNKAQWKSIIDSLLEQVK